MTKAAPLAIISSLPVILGCALLGATEARTDPYVVTIQPVGNDVEVTINVGGALNVSGLSNIFSANIIFASINPANNITMFTPAPLLGQVTDFRLEGSAMFKGPSGGYGTGQQTTTDNVMDPSVFLSNNAIGVPRGYVSGTLLDVSTTVFNDASRSSLGVTPGTYYWTWGDAPDQSFTIDLVPGPIVGAGLPGLIAASVGWSRWRGAVASDSPETFRSSIRDRLAFVGG